MQATLTSGWMCMSPVHFGVTNANSLVMVPIQAVMLQSVIAVEITMTAQIVRMMPGVLTVSGLILLHLGSALSIKGNQRL